MGDGVNIAARIEGVAEPGAVFVSGAAYGQVRDRVPQPFVDLGERDLKNIARPVWVYAVRSGSEITAAAHAPRSRIRQGPPRLSLVVLPFVNLGGEPEARNISSTA